MHQVEVGTGLAGLERADALSALRWTAIPWGFFVNTLHVHAAIWMEALGGPPRGWAMLDTVGRAGTVAAVAVWLVVELRARGAELDPVRLAWLVYGVRGGLLALALAVALAASLPYTGWMAGLE